MMELKHNEPMSSRVQFRDGSHRDETDSRSRENICETNKLLKFGMWRNSSLFPCVRGHAQAAGVMSATEQQLVVTAAAALASPDYVTDRLQRSIIRSEAPPTATCSPPRAQVR